MAIMARWANSSANSDADVEFSTNYAPSQLVLDYTISGVVIPENVSVVYANVNISTAIETNSVVTQPWYITGSMAMSVDGSVYTTIMPNYQFFHAPMEEYWGWYTNAYYWQWRPWGIPNQAFLHLNKISSGDSDAIRGILSSDYTDYYVRLTVSPNIDWKPYPWRNDSLIASWDGVHFRLDNAELEVGLI